MSSLCVITARGGSKRIPRKNIRDFRGKPVIAYSIEAALESGLFEEVMVSTDDAEIAEVARRYGAEVPFMRSAGNSDDYATTADVLREVLGEYAKRGREFGVLCCIYPTAPFVTAAKLRAAMGLLASDGEADAVMPVAAFSFPPQRGMLLEGGALCFERPENAKARSQDLPKMYHDCGQFYVYRTGAFRRRDPVLEGRVLPLVMPEAEVQDIDNESDWAMAELKYGRMVARGQDA